MRPHVINRFCAAGRSASRRRFLTALLAVSLVTIVAPDIALAAPRVMSAPEAYKAAKSGELILVDIRTPEEWQETGIGDGAIALDMRAADFVQKLVEIRKTYPAKPIAMICRTGNRSTYVTTTLDKQGFPDLVNVAEGMVGGPNGKGWIKQNLPTYPGKKSEIEARLNEVLNPQK